VVFVLKSRNGVIRLLFEPDTRNPAGANRFEQWQTTTIQQILHDRRNQHRLAGAGKSGHAEPYRRVDEPRRAVGDVVEGNASVVGKTGQRRRQGGIPKKCFPLYRRGMPARNVDLLRS